MTDTEGSVAPGQPVDRVDVLPRTALRGSVGAFLTFAAGAMILGWLQRPVEALSVLLLGAAGIPLIYRRLTGALDLFEPIQLLAAMFGLAFAVRALCLALDPALPRLGPHAYEDALSTALVYAVAGFAALAAGYVAGGRLLRDLRPPAFRAWPRHPPLGRIAVLIVIGCVGTLALVRNASAGVTAGTFLLQMAAGCVQFAAAVCAVYLPGAPRERRAALLLILFGLLVPVSALQSFAFRAKSHLLITLFVTLGALNYASGRRVRLTTAVLVGAVVLLLVFPAVNVYRAGEFRVGATDSVGAFVSSLQRLGAFLVDEGPWRNAGEAVGSVVQRFHGIDSLSLVIKYGSVAGIEHPQDYLLFPAYAFVPRAVWPSKPVNQVAISFSRAFVFPIGTDIDFSQAPSFGIFHIGDLYLCFGLGGMLIGMFVMGGLYRFLYWRYFPYEAANRRGIFMYVLLLWFVVNAFEVDIPTAYGNILKTLAVLWAVGLFISGVPWRRTTQAG